jgi:chemotaxis signal transduction protein
MVMNTDQINTARLCVFNLPGLDGYDFAVTLPEVLAIGALVEILPVQFSPYYVAGLCLWHDQLVTVINLAAALLGSPTEVQSETGNFRHMIVQTLWGAQREVIAWPVMEGVETRTVPLQDVSLSQQPLWNRALIYSTIHVQGHEYYLMNTTGFVSIQHASSSVPYHS